jgi:hypothetical protein
MPDISATLPDFSQPPFAGAAEARFAPLPADGVLPEGFFSTSNLPTYIHVEGRWLAPIRPRMDCVVVKRGGGLETIEPRRLRKGELIAMGEAEDGTEGIVVHAQGFLGGAHGGANEFRFMSTEVSRERPVNYEELAARVGEEKRRGGFLVWWSGRPLVHSAPRRSEWFIRNGYVQAVLAGNAVAVHDIEAAIFGTTSARAIPASPPRAATAAHAAINRVQARARSSRRWGPASSRAASCTRW